MLRFLKYSAMVLVVFVAIFAFYTSQAPSASPASIIKDGGKYVQLKDGRYLEYFCFGDTSGQHKHTMIEFNGFGCSAYSLTHYFSDLYQSMGIRTIAITIPGFGYSTELADRELSRWHLDVEEVLKQEDITGKIWLKGSSFGTSHAMEVAAALGADRVNGLIVSGSIIPYTEALTLTPEKAQMPPKFLTTGVVGNMFWFLISKLAPTTIDYQPNFTSLFEKYPQFHDVMTLDMKRGQNHFGWVHNMDLIARPWGFELDALKDIRTWVIYDKEDELAPYEHSLWLADKISARLIEIQGFGHASILDLELFSPVIRTIFDESQQ